MRFASSIGRSSRWRSFAVAVTAALLTSTALAQTRAWVGNFKDGSVSIVDTQKAVVVGTVAVGNGPHGMAASLDGRNVYVGLDGGSTVAVINTASERLTGRIEVGRAPHGLALSPDGRTMLVAVYGENRVVWVDLASDTIVGSVAVAKPHTIAIDPTGRSAYVASQDAVDPGLVVIDLATRTVVRRVRIAKVPRDLEYRFDGRSLYFTMAGENAVQVLDPASNRVVVATIATAASPHLAALYRGASSGLVVVQGPGEILRFDGETNRPGEPIKVGDQPHWMSPFDQGHAVAVTNEGSNTLSLIDLASGTVRSVAVGQAPRKVVTTGATNVSSAAPVGGDTSVVSIRDFAFGPIRLTVAPGTSVAWTNDDGAPHGIEFDDGSPGQDLLFPGKRFTRRFDRVATLTYHCNVHPFMTGSITVSP